MIDYGPLKLIEMCENSSNIWTIAYWKSLEWTNSLGYVNTWFSRVADGLADVRKV